MSNCSLPAVIPSPPILSTIQPFAHHHEGISSVLLGYYPPHPSHPLEKGLYDESTYWGRVKYNMIRCDFRYSHLSPPHAQKGHSRSEGARRGRGQDRILEERREQVQRRGAVEGPQHHRVDGAPPDQADHQPDRQNVLLRARQHPHSNRHAAGASHRPFAHSSSRLDLQRDSVAVDQPVVQRGLQLQQPQHLHGVQQHGHPEGVLLRHRRVCGCGSRRQQAGGEDGRRWSAGQGGSFPSSLSRSAFRGSPWRALALRTCT